MEQAIPDFMQKYFEGSDDEGKESLKAVASRYEYEQSLFFQTIFIHKQRFQRDWNRQTGSRDQVTPDEALKPLIEKYDAEAKEVAVKHGYRDEQNDETEGMEAEEKTEVNQRQIAREQFKKNLLSISMRRPQWRPRL